MSRVLGPATLINTWFSQSALSSRKNSLSVQEDGALASRGISIRPDRAALLRFLKARAEALCLPAKFEPLAGSSHKINSHKHFVFLIGSL